MIRFTVKGTPVPQGSARAFIPKGWKRAVITTANAKLKPWRAMVRDAAEDLDAPILSGAVSIHASFFLKRPKTAPKSRTYPIVKPDLDKCVRAILDSLTGVLFPDDSQVCHIESRKDYCTGMADDPERVEIIVQSVNEFIEAIRRANRNADEIPSG